MRITSGNVVEGTFHLDAFAEAELLLSLAEADRGDLIPAEEALKTFRDEVE